ncbi:non-heme iron oxygenase ferredoxin subunit [soil metagenome]
MPEETDVAHGIVVAHEGDIGEGEAIRVTRDVTGADDAIAVFFDEGSYFALNDTCTHAEASLAEGWIENGEVECPMHSGRFCLRSGAVLSMPATRDAVTHRVEVVEGDVVLFPGEPNPAS